MSIWDQLRIQWSSSLQLRWWLLATVTLQYSANSQMSWSSPVRTAYKPLGWPFLIAICQRTFLFQLQQVYSIPSLVIGKNILRKSSWPRFSKRLFKPICDDFWECFLNLQKFTINLRTWTNSYPEYYTGNIWELRAWPRVLVTLLDGDPLVLSFFEWALAHMVQDPV